MQAGHQVTPTLRLSRMLGQGGMGSVWVADHLALGTQVAVKFMSPSFAQHTGFVERFRREAMAAAQIKNPHVAQVFDHGVTAEGVPYIVMELLEGEDLKSRMKRVGPLPPAEVAHLISQAAKALGRAHQIGIVHRDVKPDNLFLLDMDGEPFVKVLDFGVAKQSVAGNLGVTSTGSMLGTPLYMSPEQLLSAKHVDFKSDLWALAVVAYHALTGHVPFSGETIGALSVAVHAGVYAPPSTARPGIPPAVDAWMQRALQRDPAARFGSAKEMAEALEHVVGVGRASMTSGMDYAAAAAQAAAMRSSSDAHAAGGEHPSASNPMSGSSPGNQGASVPNLSGSGAQGRTLAAIATTGARSERERAPIAIAVAMVAVLAAGGMGLFFVLRSGPADSPALAADEAAAPATDNADTPAAEAETAAAADAAVSTARGDAPMPAEMAPASPAPPVGATAEPVSSAGKPGGLAGVPQDSPATPSTSANQAVAPKTTGATPAQTAAAPSSTSSAKSTQTTKPTAKPRPTKDTIGF